MRLVLVGAFVFSAIFFATNAEAATACTFTRNLTYYSQGSDVACLQRYLNESGYTLASYGPGSYGQETYIFGPQTLRALSGWQAAHGIYNESGYFGPQSRSVYYSLTGFVSPYYSSPYSSYIIPYSSYGSSYSLPVKTYSLPATSISYRNTSSYSNYGVYGSVQNIIEVVIDTINDALREISLSSNSTNRKRALKSLEDAQVHLLDAITSNLRGRTTDARNDAEDALDDARRALDFVDGNSNIGSSRYRAENAIEDAKDKIDEAEDDIRNARRRGRSVSRAQDFLDDADRELRRAEDEFDDRDYRNAERFAKDAEDFARDAINAL